MSCDATAPTSNGKSIEPEPDESLQLQLLGIPGVLRGRVTHAPMFEKNSLFQARDKKQNRRDASRKNERVTGFLYARPHYFATPKFVKIEAVPKKLSDCANTGNKIDIFVSFIVTRSDR
jgi:hypothetical protein